MKKITIWALIFSVALAAGASAQEAELELPWREAGLDERQAAAHLLDRFAFGARPGEVGAVLDLGLERWIEQQLAGDLPDFDIAERLRDLKTLELSNKEIAETYPNPGRVLRAAQQAGKLPADMDPRETEAGSRQARQQRREVMTWARDQGVRPQRELLGEMMVQKLLRAVYSRNQLTEVLTDFWFNHFNVSISDNESRVFVPSYERDAIRPFVLGRFRDLLEATAKHPAMLLYLDNARSVADEGMPTTLDSRRAAYERGRSGGRRFGDGRFGDRARQQRPGGRERQARQGRRPQGLNENYARELLELHTLGVDGGYTQQDVVEVARAFSGWAAFPHGSERPDTERKLARARRFPQAGFVIEDDFIFRADAHDAGEKVVLGLELPAGRGMDDGLEVLDLLAVHRSTARHLARKLATRFVSDEPSESLVDRLAAEFLRSGGSSRTVLRSLVQAPEFWSREARGAKIKSPFELAVSALRALDAEIEEPRATIEWVQRMGQPLYAYQAPTGYPDRAEAWVNTGSLLNRMSFGLQLATGRVAGVRFDLAALHGHREPESLGEALHTYLPLLLPERDKTATLERLEPIVHDPELAAKIEQATPDPPGMGESLFAGLGDEGDTGRSFRRRSASPRPPTPAITPLARVVGVILGSPEFQRR